MHKKGGIGTTDKIKDNPTNKGGQTTNDGTKRDIAPDGDGANSRDQREQKNRWRDHEHSASPRCNAAPSFKADKDRKTMAEQSHNTGNTRTPACCIELWNQHSQQYRNNPFGNIHQKDNQGGN